MHPRVMLNHLFFQWEEFPLTCDLVLLQVDGLQRGDSGQGLRETPEPVAGEVDGPEVQQGGDFLGQTVQVIACQVELWEERREVVGCRERNGKITNERLDLQPLPPMGCQVHQWDSSCKNWAFILLFSMAAVEDLPAGNTTFRSDVFIGFLRLC